MMECVNNASCDDCSFQDYCFTNHSANCDEDDSPCFGCLDDCRLCELNFLRK